APPGGQPWRPGGGRGSEGAAGMRSTPPSRTSPSLILWALNSSISGAPSASSAESVSGVRLPLWRSTATAWLRLGGNRRSSSRIWGSRSFSSRLSERGQRRRASRLSASMSGEVQAHAGGAARLASRIRRSARPTRLLDHLGLEADLSVLRLQSEVHGLPPLLGEDAGGLLVDQLLEAVELHRRALAGLLAGLQEALIEG